MEKHRINIFTGKLYMPKIQKIKQVYGDKVYSQIENMFEAMWYSYLQEGTKGTVSLPYWSKRIKQPRAMNIALMLLSKNGWIQSKSIPGNNWGEANIREDKLLKYVTPEELASVRKSFKFSKYILKNEDVATANNRTRLNGKTKKTGIIRNGFMKTGNTKFLFDTVTMEHYSDEVMALINKGIEKMTIKHPSIADDLANYGEVGKEIIEHYIWNKGTYTAGQNQNDSRGRNISGMLNKIGNPIGFKIMRSLLVIPEADRNVATKAGLKNKYLFIAELLGYKKGTVKGKENYGRRAYFNKTVHDEVELDDLYETIWLERMYDEIDEVLSVAVWNKRAALSNYRAGNISMTETAKKVETFTGSKWSIPLEIDMSASILGIMGLLLKHKPFMDRTNMIGRTIGDAWHHDVITNRIQFKTIMRVCYGSSMPANEMWKEMKIPFTTDEVMAFETELDTGSVSVANRLKDFIIQNARPQKTMTIKLWDEEFEIECNKYFNIGEATNKFDLYDTHSNSIRRIHNTETIKRADLSSFRRFFPTLLVHGIDSQIEDNTVDAVMDAYGWAIDIHDAIILDAEATEYAKDVYCSGRNRNEPSLEKLFKTGNQILSAYFTSIGIKSNKLVDWKTDVAAYIDRHTSTFRCNRIVLK